MTVGNEISLSEARRQLSQLLRRIEADPDTIYHIKVRDRVVAELRSPDLGQGRISSGEALLRAARIAERLSPLKPGDKPHDIARHYKEYLYGGRPGGARKRA